MERLPRHPGYEVQRSHRSGKVVGRLTSVSVGCGFAHMWHSDQGQIKTGSTSAARSILVMKRGVATSSGYESDDEEVRFREAVYEESVLELALAGSHGVTRVCC